MLLYTVYPSLIRTLSLSFQTSLSLSCMRTHMAIMISACANWDPAFQQPLQPICPAIFRAP